MAAATAMRIGDHSRTQILCIPNGSQKIYGTHPVADFREATFKT